MMPSMRYLFKFIFVPTAILMSSCSSDKTRIDEEPGEIGAIVNEKEEIESFSEISYEDAVIGTSFGNWLNRAYAVGLDIEKKSNEVALRFLTNGDLTYVVQNFQPESHETFKFSINLKSLDSLEPQIRLMLARDCTTSKEEYSIEAYNLTSQEKTYSVSHTFENSHPCMKVVFQVLNATPDDQFSILLAAPKIEKLP